MADAANGWMSAFVHPFMAAMKMERKIVGLIMETAKMKTESREYHKGLRAKDTAFTRKSRLGAKHAVRMIPYRMYMGMQLAIDSYFDRANELLSCSQSPQQITCGKKAAKEKIPSQKKGSDGLG